MYSKNNKGLRVDTWGTPSRLSNVQELVPKEETYCFRVRKEEIRSFARPLIP